MRTTIDLPDDLHTVVAAIARDQGKTFNATVADLLRRLVKPDRDKEIELDRRTGLAVAHIGRPVTSEDVRALEDDE